MSRPIVVTACMAQSSESGHPLGDHGPWHLRAGEGAVHSIRTGLMHRSKQHLYSITSSARASKEGDTVRPSAFAVLRLLTSSKCTGCSTGISPGLAPLNIRSTKWAPLLKISELLAP